MAKKNGHQNKELIHQIERHIKKQIYEGEYSFVTDSYDEPLSKEVLDFFRKLDYVVNEKKEIYIGFNRNQYVYTFSWD